MQSIYAVSILILENDLLYQPMNEVLVWSSGSISIVRQFARRVWTLSSRQIRLFLFCAFSSFSRCVTFSQSPSRMSSPLNTMTLLSQVISFIKKNKENFEEGIWEWNSIKIVLVVSPRVKIPANSLSTYLYPKFQCYKNSKSNRPREYLCMHAFWISFVDQNAIFIVWIRM